MSDKVKELMKIQYENGFRDGILHGIREEDLKRIVENENVIVLATKAGNIIGEVIIIDESHFNGSLQLRFNAIVHINPEDKEVMTTKIREFFKEISSTREKA